MKTKYIFAFNLNNELDICDHILLMDLKQLKVDFVLFPFTSNGLEGQSIWINEKHFIKAIVECDEELQWADVIEMYENRSNNPDYYFMSRYNNEHRDAFKRIRPSTENVVEVHEKFELAN